MCYKENNTSHCFMNLSNISFFSTIAVLFGIIAISSCSKTEKFAGQWLGTPEQIMSIRGASDASATVTIDFAPSFDKKSSGTATISAVIEVEPSFDHLEDYDVAQRATITLNASINGSYTAQDDDDIIVSLDPSSLKVIAENDGDLADKIRVAATPTIREIFNRYHHIADIKVHHTDIMSCEIDGRDYTFRRVGVPM